MRRAAGILGAVVFLAVGASSATAATTTVQVGANGTLTFSPSSATIHVGDTVSWVWETGFHSSTSGSPPGTPDGKWDSGQHGSPFTFQQTFTQPGTFQYYCSVHFSLGMTGSIRVLPPFIPRLWVSNNSSNSASLFAANATGNAKPLATLSGALTGLSNPFGLGLDGTGQLRVASAGASSLSLFAVGASGNAAPASTVSGSSTGLASPEGLAVDAAGHVFTADHSSNAITEYAPTAVGNVAPLAAIAGTATGLSGPVGVARDAAGHLFVANGSANSITEYAAGAKGNVSPIATIQGAATQLSSPSGIAVGPGSRLFVANAGSNAITEYSSTTNGNIAPSTTVSGAGTGLDAPGGIAVDAAGNLIVPNSGNGTVTEYVGSASGNSSPFATLSGAGTLLSSPMFVALQTPSVATGAATAITVSSATLNGTVDPNAAGTHVFFQYGTTTAYGKTTMSQGVGSGTSSVAVSASIGQLLPSTTYHYRAVASSDAGTRFGHDATFTTPA